MAVSVWVLTPNKGTLLIAALISDCSLLSSLPLPQWQTFCGEKKVRLGRRRRRLTMPFIRRS